MSYRIYRTVLAIFLFLALILSTNAASFDLELHHRILNAKNSSKPYISNNSIMMSYSAPPGTQAVSLALERENFSTFYNYEKNRHGIFILTMKIPEGQKRIRYRMIVDGLWTTDPNSNKEYDNRGILVSTLDIPLDTNTYVPGIRKLPDGRTRFVFFGKPNSNVFLVGDFNKWDPYLTQMAESLVYEGIYTVTLRLPPDSQYYRYVVGGKEILDPENPLNARNRWGEKASIIRQ